MPLINDGLAQASWMIFLHVIVNMMLKTFVNYGGRCLDQAETCGQNEELHLSLVFKLGKGENPTGEMKNS